MKSSVAWLLRTPRRAKRVGNGCNNFVCEFAQLHRLRHLPKLLGAMSNYQHTFASIINMLAKDSNGILTRRPSHTFRVVVDTPLTNPQAPKRLARPREERAANNNRKVISFRPETAMFGLRYSSASCFVCLMFAHQIVKHIAFLKGLYQPAEETAATSSATVYIKRKESNK